MAVALPGLCWRNRDIVIYGDAAFTQAAQTFSCGGKTRRKVQKRVPSECVL